MESIVPSFLTRFWFSEPGVSLLQQSRSSNPIPGKVAVQKSSEVVTICSVVMGCRGLLVPRHQNVVDTPSRKNAA